MPESATPGSTASYGNGTTTCDSRRRGRFPLGGDGDTRAIYTESGSGVTSTCRPRWPNPYIGAAPAAMPRRLTDGIEKSTAPARRCPDRLQRDNTRSRQWRDLLCHRRQDGAGRRRRRRNTVDFQVADRGRTTVDLEVAITRWGPSAPGLVNRYQKRRRHRLMTTTSWQRLLTTRSKAAPGMTDPAAAGGWA